MKRIVIVGPTAIGKTKLSLELAHYYNAEIINADSTQIYKGMDIATAKEKNLRGIKHHLLSIKELNEDYSIYDYQKDGRDILDNTNKNIVIVGGTGLYINSLLYNYELKEKKIFNNYDDFTNEEIYNKLKTIDPNIKEHINNRRRLIGLLEKYENDSIHSNKGSELLYKDTIFIGLTTDRDILYDRINKRVDEMIKNGLVEEAKELYDRGIKTKAVMTPIGYKELFLYFDKKITLEESIELIKKRTRNYAKRQYTWFNNKLNIQWFRVDFDCFNNVVDNVINYINKTK